MNLQHIAPVTERPDVIQSKYRYGILYGAVVGSSFALFSWGLDAWVLSSHHGMQAFLKLGVGILLCAAVGSLAGWIAARLNRVVYSFVIWLVAAFALAWLSVFLTALIFPRLLALFEPQTEGLIHYYVYEGFRSRMIVGYAWIAVFTSIAGLLQIPLSDSAVFSTSFFGRIGPLLITVFLMALCGLIVDNGVVNEPLRSAVVALDDTIQFVVDHRGQEVDRTESRRMFAASLRTVDDLVSDNRTLIVSEYDEVLGEIKILVKFDDGWAMCRVVYNQPNYCEPINTGK